MKKYPLIPLGELGEIVTGSTPDSTNKEYWNGDIAWITPADLTNHEGIYFTGKLRKITEAGYKSCSTKLMPAGSIVYSTRAPIGHCAITSFPLCTNQGFKSIVPNKRLDAVYGFFALKFFTPQLEALGRGATFAEVNKETFESFEIPLPPLEEQKRIASLLARADRLRGLRRAAREQCDSLLQSVFLEMFGHVRVNDKKWELAKFENVCESRLGKMLDDKKQTGKHKRQYLRNFNVQWFRFDLSDIAEMDFDEKDRKEFRLQYGDILMCEGGEVGRCAIWKGEIKECYFQKALHRVRPNPELVKSEYLVYLFWWLAQTGGLGDFTSQVTIAHLTGEKLKELIIPVPPLALQEEFARVVARVEALRARMDESARQGEALFQSLLAESFG